MREVPRRVVAIGAPLMVFALLLRPVYIGEWYAMRELFRLAMNAGLLKSGGNFWGQIHGLNIPAHAEAFHLLVRLGALGLTLAPLILVCLLLWYSVRVAPVMGVRRWTTLRRAALCVGGAMIVLVFIENPIEWYTQSLVFRAGKAAGCEYIAISVLWTGPDGPFTGGPWAWAFNPLYTHGPWALARVLTFGLAWGAMSCWSRRDPRPRHGQCARCGYEHTGPTPCPECGLAGPA